MAYTNSSPITPVFLVDGYGNALSLSQGITLPDGAVSQLNDLTININGFNYDIGGNKGYFEGALNQLLTDEATNYIYLTATDEPELIINTTGYPLILPHLRLARVFADGGVITSIILDRTFLTAGDSSSILTDLITPTDLDASDGYVGDSIKAARADHKHQILAGSPISLGITNDAGILDTLSRSDHQHAHDNQPGGALHAQVNSSTDGFMIASDKIKLDTIATGATNTPLTLTAPVDVSKSTAIIGVLTTAARSDHKHDISTAAPIAIGTSNSEGTASSLSRSDHTHNHGNQPGGSLHSQVNSSVDGFMIAADKVKLDTVATGAQVVNFTNVNAALGTANASIGVNNQKITSILDPTDPQDAATKNYVDAIASGMDIKASCRVATTGNILLTGLQTIDGILVIIGDRVLVKNQLVASQNGIYTAALLGWSRSSDADSNAEVTSGLFTFIEEGTLNANSGWILTTADPITLGATSLTFVQFTGAGQIDAGDGLTKTGNTINAVGNPDGSILTNADNIQVGVLATDAQHGNRGNGSLHTVATTSINGFMSSTDKLKLDGVASGATNTPLTSTLPVNVSKSAAIIGISTEAARQDHKHNIDTATAVSLSTVNAEGTATTLARSDHTHDHANQAGGTLHSAATISVNGFMSSADKTKLDGIATGATNTALASTPPVDVDADTAVIGVGSTAARADHKHNIATAAPSSLTAGGSNTIGSSVSLSRADHIHALPAFGTTAGTFCQGNDVRLSDKRAPTITSEATGDIMYFNGTNWVRLAATTANNILITNGASTAPSWTAASNIVIFGTQYNQIVSNATATTTGTVYVNKATLTLTGIPAGDYHISWYCEVASNTANRQYEMQLDINNGTVVANSAENLTTINLFTAVSGVHHHTFAAGNHTIDLDFRRHTASAATTISIRNTRIICWRVS